MLGKSKGSSKKTIPKIEVLIVDFYIFEIKKIWHINFFKRRRCYELYSLYYWGK